MEEMGEIINNVTESRQDKTQEFGNLLINGWPFKAGDTQIVYDHDEPLGLIRPNVFWCCAVVIFLAT